MDDTFSARKQDPQTMLSERYDIHPKVNFAFEPMINNQMLFFECLFVKDCNNLEVEAYKNQHTGVNIFISPLT